MMPPWRRRRAIAVAGAGLCGVVIAVALIGNDADEVTQDAAATSAAPNDPARSVPPRTARALDQLRLASAAPAQLPNGELPLSSWTDPSDDPLDAGESDEGAADEDGAASNSDADSADDDRAIAAAVKPKPGSIDRQAIQDAMKRMKPLIRGCYEEGLEHDPSLAGRVVIEFEISGEEGRGVVKQGTVADSEVASPFFEACVLQKVSGLDAPAPEGGGVVKVRYPFTFDPGGGFGGEPAGGDGEKTP